MMRPIVRTAVTCLSISAFSQAVDAQSSSDAENAEGVTVEEVVVTAQKREERLQDVPISISVVGGDALDKSSDSGVIDAVSRVPGVFATVTNQGARSGSNAAIAIRGVSAGTVGANTVGYYLDSVPFGRASASSVPDTSPYDLDRVEVLRGPQGTLYGASALNGVVRVLTKNPDMQDFEFKSRASLSNTDNGSESYSADAAFNAPLIQDKLAARVVLGYQELGGWIDNPALAKKDANDTEKKNARVKLAAQPTQDFSVGVSAWISRSDSGAPPFSNDGGRSTLSPVAEPSNTDFDSYNLDLNYDAGPVTIKSATSYLDFTLDNIFDISYASDPSLPPGSITTQIVRNDTNVFSEELLLSSAGGAPWRWTLGSIYRDAQDDADAATSRSLARGISTYESKSFAVFGELTRAFADGRFEVTGGLRYFRDKASRFEESRQSAVTANPIPAGGLLSFEDTFTKTTPRAVLSWHPDKNSTLYASYSKGFRSGLFQEFTILSELPNTPPAKPDTLTNYEIGAKGNTLGGRLTFDTAAYYIDWKDVQQDTLVLLSTGSAPAFVNGKSLSGVGLDLAVTYSPVDPLVLGLTFGWNDLTFDADVLNQGLVAFPKGSRRTNSPKTTAGLSIAYAVPLGSSGYRGRLSASGNYIAEQITGARANFLPGLPVIGSYSLVTADSVTLVRASFAVEAPMNWTAALFVDNVTNEEGIQPDPFLPTGQTNTVLRPRTYGVQFEYRY